MQPSSLLDERLTVEVHASESDAPNLAKDVLAGLSSQPKRLPPIYFYDEIGSRLFERITRLPEYYITRTEHAILKRYAPEIAAYAQGSMSLIELGSGSSSKTRLLIEALIASQGHLHYFPIDISPSVLKRSAKQLLADYPALSITAHVAEYNTGIRRIAEEDFEQKLVIFLGSNIGNFEPQPALDFMRKVRRELGADDYFLLGTDMQKDAALLNAAYDDAQGVTAEFNRNVLHRINRELDGEFEVDLFSHLAFYKPAKTRAEIYLRSEKKQEVYIGRLDRAFHFKRGETIHTENSYKYNLEQIRAMCRSTGFHLVRRWQDPSGYFSLNLLKPN